MDFCCYGVRGSRPVPSSLDIVLSIFSKVCDILPKKAIADCKNSHDMRECIQKYIPREKLHMIFGPGGNTPCVEVIPKVRDDDTHVLFDMGTGITNVLTHKNSRVFHVFFSHFHYDHVQGLPFAPWLYDKNITVHFYSPMKGFETILRNVMQPPYFPITTVNMTQNMYFHEICDKTYVDLQNMRITWKELNHPGKSYAYKIEEDDKTFCYFTDVNIQDDLFEDTRANKTFLHGIDSMILDASMGFVSTVKEQDWGHTSLFKGLSFCKKWNVSHVYLFHFSPSDTLQHTLLHYQIAQWYNKAIKSNTAVSFAQENIRIAV